MKTNAIWLTLALTLAILAGCSTPATPSDHDTSTQDTCSGPNCQGDGKSDIKPDDVDVTAPDSTDDLQGDLPEEVDVDCNECTKDQVMCLEPKRYRTCEEVDGCWKWSSKQQCPAATPACVCGEEDAVCVPANDEPCVCMPDCDGVECGLDGCGGTCGNGPKNGCTAPAECVSGKCTTECVSECNAGETQCNGDQVVTCADTYAGVAGKEPCFIFGQTAPCPALQICDPAFDACVCKFKDCEGTCCEDATYTCFGNTCCKPNCEELGNECGSDGCGGSCGTCAEGSFCSSGSCLDTCPGNECVAGEQLCQGGAGYLKCTDFGGGCWLWSEVAFACGAGTVCDAVSNKCKCAPQCAGKNCGPDGCGGECGACEYPETCGTGGTCVCQCGTNVNPVCDLATNTTYDNACKALCAGAEAVVQGACPTCSDLCTDEEKEPFQFCGNDYVTYDSFCQLKCELGSAQCTSMFTCPQVLYPGECQPAVCEGCPTTLDPMCGSDGQTYFNKCDLLGCAPQGTGIDCMGECVNTGLCPACTSECAPVCGQIVTGGGNIIRKTYGNTCSMTCDGATLAEEGPCCNTCSSASEWVCSKDYHAFKNECIAECKAPEETPTLYIIPTGTNGLPQTEVCEECKCDLSEDAYAPICGANYQSYYNECAMNCFGTTARCQGECSFEDCPCPVATGGLGIETEIATPPNAADSLQRGVCGADGRTYGNECSASYFGTYVVQPTWCPTCAAECAGIAYQPYCCEDKVTYPNLCIPQKCNSKLNPSLCQKGRCCTSDADCDDKNAATVESCNLVAGVCETL